MESAVAAGVVPIGIAETLADPAAYADDRIYDAYAWLRRHVPLGKATLDGYKPFWVVTRHADILEVSRNNEVFSNGAGQLVFMTERTDRSIRERTGGRPHVGNSLITMDGAEHRAYRRITQSWFMPGALKKLQGRIEAIACRSVEAMIAKGPRCDFVADVASYYPLEIVLEIVGVPAADFDRVLELSQKAFAPLDPDVSLKGHIAVDAHADALLTHIGALRKYFIELIRERRADPRDDLATVIAQSDVLGEPISDFHAAGYLFILGTAGHETTASSLSLMMQVLAERPEMLEALKAGPDLLPGFIEEGIRYGTPVKTFMRTALRDAELRGQAIKAGDWLMLCYASGDRDEAVFADPEQFDMRRSPNPQLAFGYGAHMCLGQHLARSELKAFLTVLLPRLGWARLTGPALSTKATTVNGLRTLPIECGWQ